VLTVAVAQSFIDDNLASYILVVLWMMSCLHNMLYVQSRSIVAACDACYVLDTYSI